LHDSAGRQFQIVHSCAHAQSRRRQDSRGRNPSDTCRRTLPRAGGPCKRIPVRTAGLGPSEAAGPFGGELGSDPPLGALRRELKQSVRGNRRGWSWLDRATGLRGVQLVARFHVHPGEGGLWRRHPIRRAGNYLRGGNAPGKTSPPPCDFGRPGRSAIHRRPASGALHFGARAGPGATATEPRVEGALDSHQGPGATVAVGDGAKPRPAPGRGTIACRRVGG